MSGPLTYPACEKCGREAPSVLPSKRYLDDEQPGRSELLCNTCALDGVDTSDAGMGFANNGAGAAPKAQLAEDPRVPDPWPDLTLSKPLPPFPVDALPRTVADWVKATANATQTPVEVAAFNALGVLSACAAGSVKVEVKPGWEEEVCLWLMCVLESGERKSAVQRAAVAPFREFEKEWREERLPALAKARNEREIKEQRHAKLVRDAAREDVSKVREGLEAQAGEIASWLASTPEEHPPRLLADDATPEALAKLLSRHGQIAVISAESALLDNLFGRYSEGKANFNLVNQAYTGEWSARDRSAAKEFGDLDRPLLTLVLTPQPAVLAELLASKSAHQLGFVPRFMFAAPLSRLGGREIDPEPVSAEVAEAWGELVRRIAKPRKRVTEVTQPASVTSVTALGLSTFARDLLFRVSEAQERLLCEGGTLRPIAAWQGRYAGRAIRIAALLHLAAGDEGTEISGDTMAASLEIGEWSLAHAIDVLTGPDPLYRRAVKWLGRHGESEVSRRELQRALHIDRSDTTVRLVERLQGADLLQALPAPEPSEQGGRPRSPRYAVHPDLIEQTKDPDQGRSA